MATFFLRSTKTSGTAPLSVKVRKSTPKKIEVVYNTGIMVGIDSWNKSQKSARAMDAYQKSDEGKKAYELIRMVDNVISQMYDGSAIPERSEIQEAIDDIVQHEAREILRHEAEKQEELLKLIEERESNDVLAALDKRISRMESGELLKVRGGEKYTEGTLIRYRYFRRILSIFIKKHGHFTWDEIDKNLLDKFVGMLSNGNAGETYMDNTINGFLGYFRTLVRMEYKEGSHNNKRALNLFENYTRRIHEDRAQNEIYLTAEEVQALYDMQLDNPYESQVRDLFLAGVYTCQRISDYSRLDKSSFSTTAKGTNVVRIVQQKTGKNIVVPLLSDNLLNIMERNNWDFTHRGTKHGKDKRFQMTVIELNATIKLICKKLSTSVPSLAKLEYTYLTQKDYKSLDRIVYDKDGRPMKHRYDMVSSHTARRTGITLLYQSQLFDNIQMMSISGHTSESIFMKYIRMTKDEIADEIARKIGNESLF